VLCTDEICNNQEGMTASWNNNTTTYYLLCTRLYLHKWLSKSVSISTRRMEQANGLACKLSVRISHNNIS